MSLIVVLVGGAFFLAGRWILGIGWSFTGASTTATTIGGHTTLHEGFDGQGGISGWVLGTAIKVIGAPILLYGIACLVWGGLGLVTQSSVGLPLWDQIASSWNATQPSPSAPVLSSGTTTHGSAGQPTTVLDALQQLKEDETR